MKRLIPELIAGVFLIMFVHWVLQAFLSGINL